MKEEWKIKNLEEICDFQNGFAFKSKTFKENGIPVVRITNIQNNSIELDKCVFIDSKDYTQDLSKYEVRKGDLLIAMSGATTGKIGIHRSDETLLLNQRVGLFKPKNTLNKDYLYYFLATNVENSLAISAGAAQPNLSTEQIKNFQIPLPPLPEQHRIVSILDHCFEAIDKAKANAEQNLQNAKELFESYLQGVFEKRGENWKNVNIDSVCEVVNGGTPKTKVKEYWNGDVNWITPADLGKLDSVLVNETSRKITELGLQKSSAKLFKENSVILSTRAPIGHLAINTVPMSTNQGCRGLVPNKNLNTWFLYYFLKGNIQLLNDLGTGATFLELSSKALKSVIIPLPPLKDQIRLVSILNKYVEASQNLETHYQKRIDDLEELKKSILQKAFAGELKTEKMVEETPLAPISESVCCEAERI